VENKNNIRKGYIRAVADMNDNELRIALQTAWAKIFVLVERREQKTLDKVLGREHLLQGIPSASSFQAFYREEELFYIREAGRMRTDDEQWWQVKAKEYLLKYYRPADPAIDKEGSKRSGTALLFLGETLIELFLRPFVDSGQVPEAWLPTSRLFSQYVTLLLAEDKQFKKYKRNSGFSLYTMHSDVYSYNAKDKRSCILGLFPTAELIELVRNSSRAFTIDENICSKK
jgi:hypothetical protein